MDAYDRCTNEGGKNLADSVAIYGRGRELFRPATYINNVSLGLTLYKFCTLLPDDGRRADGF